ncbi:MAG: serine/threonine-protein kinase [Bacillota bacterium]
MNDLLDKYDNMGQIGSGNFGTVYKAYNKLLDRIEAIKVINNVSQFDDEETLEAKVQHKLKHNNVTEIYDAFIRNGKLYILMEFLDGGSIQSILKKGKLSVKDTIKYGIDVLYGMQLIHNSGYIHRDIKPSNILLDKKRMAKLSDFGLISKLDAAGKYSSGFAYVKHKAPEVLLKNENSRVSDIYSLGLTLFRMLNGDDTLIQYQLREIPDLIIKGKFPPRDTYSPDVPKKLMNIINRALDINPDSRYPNAHEMRSALSQIQVPIDWNLIRNSDRKQTWFGNNSGLKYEVEFTRSLVVNKYTIEVKKGFKELRKINKYCFNGIPEKEAKKRIAKILTMKF